MITYYISEPKKMLVGCFNDKKISKFDIQMII